MSISKCLIRCVTVSISVFAIFLSYAVHAEQKAVSGEWDIHYIAFPSTFIEPNIAKNYGITRSGYRGIVNISVLDNSQSPTKPLEVDISGRYRNLLGNGDALSFKKIVEPNAIYYIADFPYSNQETVRFEVTVNNGEKSHTVKFQDQFYVD